MAFSQEGGTAHLSFLQSFSVSSELQGGSSDNVCCTGTERLSLWSSLSRCYCGSTDTLSPSPSPSKRRGRGRLLTPSLLSGRTRETCSSLVKTPPPLEVVEILGNDDESSIAEPSQPIRPKLSSSSSDGDKVSQLDEDQQISEIDNLQVRRGRSQSSKQHVRWKTPDEDSESQESNEIPEQELHRTEKKRKTLNTWMSALLDVSEGGFDTTVVPEPTSPARSHWSHRTASLLPPSPTGVSPASGKSRGWRTPEGSATSSPAKSNRSPLSPPGQVSILCLLRGHFLGNVDADGSGHFTREELFDHIKELLERTSGSLGSEDLELLGEVVPLSLLLCKVDSSGYSLSTACSAYVIL